MAKILTRASNAWKALRGSSPDGLVEPMSFPFKGMDFPEQAPKNFSVRHAAQLPAVQAAVGTISNRISILPLYVYDISRTGEESRVEALDDEARILSTRWSDFTTAIDGIQHFIESCLLYGKAACHIERENYDPEKRINEGDVVAIHPIDPVGVTRQQVDSEIQYRITFFNGVQRVVDRKDIFFLPFKRPRDGITDVSPLYTSWPSIRSALASTYFAAWYFNNAATANLMFTKAESDANFNLTEELKAMWRVFDRMRAQNRREGMATPGWDVKNVGGNPQEAQLDQNRTFGVQEVARVYDIPPTLLQDLSRGTYSNYSQQRNALSEVIERWAVRVCAEFSNILWPEGNRICRFDTSLAIREPFNIRQAGYEIAIRAGTKTRNECRILEGDEPSDAEGMDDFNVSLAPSVTIQAQNEA